MSRLVEKLLAIHEALGAARQPHAFGGAIALAYCTREPRGTRDLDLNIFAPAARAESALGMLPSGVAVGGDDIEAARRDGQVRLWWDDTPVDIFLNTLDFHDEVARRVNTVELADHQIPVIDGVSLTVFKAYFDRGRDWADIEAIAQWDAATVERAAAVIAAFSGLSDRRRTRLLQIAGRHSGTNPASGP